jgi:hypothetical protein
VIGRTVILKVSVRTRKGVSILGAPLGDNPARNEEGDKEIPDRIIESQRGSPKDKVKIRCLVKLKT